MLRKHLTAELIEAGLSEGLMRMLKQQRWMNKSHCEHGKLRVIDTMPVSHQEDYVVFCLISLGLNTERYSLILKLTQKKIRGSSPELIGALDVQGKEFYVYEGGSDPQIGALLCKTLAFQESVAGKHGQFRAVPLGISRLPKNLQTYPMDVEQSNTAWNIDQSLFLKWYRRLPEGKNNEFEVLTQLLKSKFKSAPRMRGYWEYTNRKETTTLGIIQDWVPDAADGWFSLLQAVNIKAFKDVKRWILGLAKTTAEFHQCLENTDDPAFVPEPLTKKDMRQSIRALEHEVAALAEMDAMDAHWIDDLRQMTQALSLDSAFTLELGQKQRIHGDYHLGQVLFSSEECFVVDFEGEPRRDLSLRAEKQSPLRDVAGMLRSLSYLRWTAKDCDNLNAWEQETKSLFVQEYLKAMQDSYLLPRDTKQVTQLIEFFECEKLVYEFHYEASFRPDWLRVPVQGLNTLKKKVL